MGGVMVPWCETNNDGEMLDVKYTDQNSARAATQICDRNMAEQIHIKSFDKNSNTHHFPNKWQTTKNVLK